MSKEIIIKGKDAFIDDRGSILNYTLTEPVNVVGLIITKAGSVRSNHYHPKQEQKLLLISGKYISVTKDVHNKDSPIDHHLIESGDLVITPPMIAHTTIFLEDSTMINLIHGNRYHHNFKEHTIRYELVSEGDVQKYLDMYT